MTMTARTLAELTFEEVRDLEPLDQAVAILPVGAIEAHGPHLPLGTDAIIAEAMAREGAARIEAAGRPALVLPTLAYTAAPFAAAFTGTLSIGGATTAGLVFELARELDRHDFAALAIANAHLDPAHLDALAAGAARAEDERLLPVIFPNLTRKPWAPRL